VREAALKHLQHDFPEHLQARFTVEPPYRIDTAGSNDERIVLACIRVTTRWIKSDAASPAVMAQNFDQAMEASGWHVPGGDICEKLASSKFSRTVNVRVIPIERERWIRIVSTIWISMSTSFLTDFYAPLFIGAGPVLYVLCRCVMSWIHH
jgi:hypothetical protein